MPPISTAVQPYVSRKMRRRLRKGGAAALVASTMTATVVFGGASSHPLLRPEALLGHSTLPSMVSEAYRLLADYADYMGGTGNPTAQLPHMDKLLGGSLNAGRTVVYVYTPEQFRYTTGVNDMTYDQSVAEGTRLAEAKLAEQTADPQNTVVFVGISQSSSIIGQMLRDYEAHPETAPNPDQVKFVAVSSPNMPNGGILVRFAGLPPFGGITFGKPSPVDTQYDVTYVRWAYDGLANFPAYVGNGLADLNALMGLYYEHSKDPNITAPGANVSETKVGNTTFDTLFPEHLPLLMPLYQTGWGGLANVIEPTLRVLVNVGYTNNDPAADPGTTTTAKLLPPPQNILVAVKQLPGAALEGISTIPAGVKLFMSDPVRIIHNDIVSTQQAAAAIQSQIEYTLKGATNGLPSVPSVESTGHAQQPAGANAVDMQSPVGAMLSNEATPKDHAVLHFPGARQVPVKTHGVTQSESGVSRGMHRPGNSGASSGGSVGSAQKPHGQHSSGVAGPKRRAGSAA